jgi:hypothetical protein
MLQLLTNFQGYIDPYANFLTFYNTWWNIDTATGWGLDNFGRILGVTRLLAVPAAGPFFGFDQAGSMLGFGQAPFYSYAGETTTYALPDSTYRTLLLTKALANISNCSIPALNQLITNLFPGRGRCYCTDPGSMTMTYTFEFVLLPVEIAILEQSGALPHPTGVSVTIVQAVVTSGLFGFDGSNLQPFNQGTFFNPTVLQ